MNNLGFKKGNWVSKIDVEDFIKINYEEYKGDSSFLSGASKRSKKLMEKVNALFIKEADNNGVLSIDTSRITSIDGYGAGYLDKNNEIIVGLQTSKPLERGVNIFGGIRMANDALLAYGQSLPEEIKSQFRHVTTHNDGVFKVYSDEMKMLRKSGVITGLPDSYGRGRIIGDYRRVALYGLDFLISEKINDKKYYSSLDMSEANIKLCEELHSQINSLKQLKTMALSYGIDISLPATNTKQAIQWLYFAYLASIKEQNGAAMSLGRVSTFIDIYATKDLNDGLFDENQIQEMIDDFIIKLRIARQLRTQDYNEVFAGDPMWITESIGGMLDEHKSLVTKTSFRFLQTLYNLGSAPEPNLTVLWSKHLPLNFKKFCAQVSIDTDSIQYENDDLMRLKFGSDYAIACCVSAMKVGKQMQYFGARCNLPKLLLLALNGGIDELTGIKIGPHNEVMNDEYLDYDKVVARFEIYEKWLAKSYINTLNVIHFMHDKYAYENIQMALHDSEVTRFMACGVAGLSVITDSLSAIKYAKVKPLINESGYIYDFETTGDFPKFGNDIDQVDEIAVNLLRNFLKQLQNTTPFRNSITTLSALTITSNVMYGKKTGSTPDGRKKGEPFAPGANPMHNREESGVIASLNSVCKLDYNCCEDGISNTFSIVPSTMGKEANERTTNLVTILDGYFSLGGHHLNVNVLNKEKLIDAMNNPSSYPNLTIRVSGYAVNFTKLNKEQQLEVISRTYHEKM